MARRATKIVATLGPASSDPPVLERMIRAGVNVVRLNFSHGTAQDHIDRARLVRDAAQKAGREVAIMADLQGPKIRVGKFAEGKVLLEPGAKFVLDAGREELGDVEVRLMTQETWPFENGIAGLASGEEINETCDEDDPNDDGGVESDNVLYIVEGEQLKYGTKKAWEVAS